MNCGFPGSSPEPPFCTSPSMSFAVHMLKCSKARMTLVRNSFQHFFQTLTCSPLADKEGRLLPIYFPNCALSFSKVEQATSRKWPIVVAPCSPPRCSLLSSWQAHDAMFVSASCLGLAVFSAALLTPWLSSKITLRSSWDGCSTTCNYIPNCSVLL